MFNLITDAESLPYWEGAKQNKLMIQKCNITGNCFLYSRRLSNVAISDRAVYVQRYLNVT